ncbi:hypothetical protein CEXT_356551 [Caerostris extrusa]|uniref:Uncharacterized protein n=1 Tax=Caerostris extrusa TaxID=172846 RepID=A0AAV4XFT4_CAEEX|nr:hypothetical protein CEXT_356551 [Caerostris extrusa]
MHLDSHRPTYIFPWHQTFPFSQRKALDSRATCPTNMPGGGSCLVEVAPQKSPAHMNGGDFRWDKKKAIKEPKKVARTRRKANPWNRKRDPGTEEGQEESDQGTEKGIQDKEPKKGARTRKAIKKKGSRTRRKRSRNRKSYKIPYLQYIHLLCFVIDI